MLGMPCVMLRLAVATFIVPYTSLGSKLSDSGFSCSCYASLSLCDSAVTRCLRPRCGCHGPSCSDELSTLWLPWSRRPILAISTLRNTMQSSWHSYRAYSVEAEEEAAQADAEQPVNAAEERARKTTLNRSSWCS